MKNEIEVYRPELVAIVEKSEMDQTDAQVILERFQEFFQIASDWKKKTEAIVITSPDQKAEMAMARNARLFIRSKRLEVQKAHKAMKEDSLRKGRTLDNIKRIILDQLEPLEAELLEKEEFAERLEIARRQELAMNRLRALSGLDGDHSNLILADLTEEQFEAIRLGAEEKTNARIAREKAEEEERIAAEKRDREERERLRVENERLQEELRAEAERNFAERTRLQRQQEEAARKAAEEAAELRRQAEEANKAAEAARRKEAERLAAELAAREAAAAKELAERKAAEEAARKAASAPDREKLGQFREEILSLAKKCPKVSDPEYKQLADAVIERLTMTANLIKL